MADTVDSERVREFNEEDSPEFQDKLDRMAAMVRASKYTVFYTGAGISTSAGVGDYRGPSGAWTKRKIKELECKKRTKEEDKELKRLLEEAKREEKKATKKVPMTDAQPTLSHMAMSTLIHKGLAHFVVTTNLDGIHRKSGLQGHDHLCNLHGDIYIERCTACGADFERNYHVRQDFLHVHDHKVGKCEKCGSDTPKHYTGTKGTEKMKKSKWGGRMIGTRDKNCGTKDTHINFGEFLDKIDWNEAQEHCGKADLCIIAGTSMSLRHITHFPFMAKKVVLINLQATPDDDKADLRIWAKCDPVFEGLMERLGIEIDPIPVWRPRDSVPIDKIPKYVHPYYVEAAKRLEEVAQLREAEAAEREAEKQRASGLEKGDDGSDEKEKEADAKEKGEKATSKKDKKRTLVNAVLGNTHEQQDKKLHKWTLFLRPQDKQAEKQMAEEIDHVLFGLHPTFSPSEVTVEQPPFEITRSGWGYFDVGVSVYWKEELHRKPVHLSHQLDFHAPETSRPVHL